MSVVFNYLRLSEPVLDAVLADEAEAERLIDRLVEDYGWDPPEASGLGIADANNEWDAIHYVLDSERRVGRLNSGSPAADAVRGEVSLSPNHRLDWIGYSRPPRVREIARALADVDIFALAKPLASELREAGARDDLYRGSEPRWVAHWFEPMRALYLSASERSQAVLVFAS